jgi:pimeloyl-ACP methyl ester carboxylesterase
LLSIVALNFYTFLSLLPQFKKLLMDAIISKDGTAIAVWQTGAGEPLLLVHGTSGDHTMWNPVIAGLAQQFSVYCMDRRGRGASGDAVNYTLERECEDIAAVVAAIGGDVHVAGHSFGGLCVLEAAQQITQLGRLIIYEPPLSLQGSAWSVAFQQHMQNLLVAGDNEAVLLLFFRELLKMPDNDISAMQLGANWSERVAEAGTIVRELESIDSYVIDTSRFQGLLTPTLLLLGSDSPPRRYHIAQMLHENLPNSQLVHLHKQQHSAIRNAPELFVQELVRFIYG